MTIVYVLISREKDYYYEQLLVSLYSLRRFHPDANVVVLVDDETKQTLTGKRQLISELASEIKIVDVPSNYSPKERSRFLKTSLRSLLKGDFFFIDTDTVIADTLDGFGNFDGEIGAVLDYHAPLNKLIDGNDIRNRIHEIFGVDVSDEQRYFNSGVLFVRDTDKTHQLFDKWRKYWDIAAFEKNECYDQPALLMADREMGHIIQELDGTYNCQILTSFQYLHQAKIIHFFNNQWEGKEKLSPFFEERLYAEIKETGTIPEGTKRLLENPRSAFYSPSYYVEIAQVEFLNTLVGKTLLSFYRKKTIGYSVLKFLCNLRFKAIVAYSKLRQ